MDSSIFDFDASKIAGYDLENPKLIYDGPANAFDSPAPLILVHDGGGTTFSYHCLDPVFNRPLYGIENPHLLSDGGSGSPGWWDGGIPEMARHYVELLGKAFPQGGEILLGGWSMGGVLSLEMARLIATQGGAVPGRPRFTVLGMVFVDSVCPARAPIMSREEALRQRITKTPEELAGMTLKEKVGYAMFHARLISQQYCLPDWKGRPIPRTILLRAKEYITDQRFKHVDRTRKERMLGWEEYSRENGGFMSESDMMEVEGHHFSIFEEARLKDVSKKICRAADMLDEEPFC